jgi:peptidoglycan hydrolase-like protein with peptidoglycan-binding domain/DNA invertase Pin-like site-specific DNA recombinase
MQAKRIAVAIALAVAVALTVPSVAVARDVVAMASAGWQGRAIEDPQPRPQLGQTSWPVGWDAGAVARGAGYSSPDGSQRVRDLQRRLRQLGYRPGPVDGRFGPRTEAATRWFQHKHGLDLTGRADRPTTAVLRARSEHRSLPAGGGEPRQTGGDQSRAGVDGTGQAGGDESAAGAEAPLVIGTQGGDEGIDPALILIAALLALVAGLLLGSFGPELLQSRRRDEPVPEPPPAPAATPVYGYVTVDAALHADTAIAALSTLCARRGWSLEKIVHDREPSSGSLADRPALVYALREIRAGAASGLIVTRVRDLTTRFGDLVALVELMTDAGAFVASADRELDTSTGTGRATAHAIVELAGWQRRPGTRRPRHDLAAARFRSSTEHDLGRRLAAMRDRGIPLRAIADALNLARIPNPTGHTHWRPANVQAATREEGATRS